MMAGTGKVEGYAGLIDEFSKCWGYLDHLGKIAKNASMEGTNEGLNIEEMGRVEFLAGNSNEKSQVDFIARWVEKIMIDYTRAQKTKMKVRCNFYNRGFCREGSLCDFEHPAKLCEQYTQDGICSRRHCKDRHTYKCKYFLSQHGCFRGGSCEYFHEMVTNIDEDCGEIDDRKDFEVDTTNDQNEESVESAKEIKTLAADVSKDITVGANETQNADKKVDDEKEVNMKHGEEFGDESDGFLLLERAIADGRELDNDLLDKILESMEKGEEPKENKKVKEKKVKTKKVKTKKVKKARGKACEKHLTN